MSDRVLPDRVAHQVFRLKNLLPASLSFLLGVASVLGYAPFYFYPVCVFALACVAWMWSHSESGRMAALSGFAFGIGLFGAGISWVYVSLHDFGGMPAFVAGACTFAFCAFLALFPGIIAGVVRLAGPGVPTLLLLFPALWMLGEWTRSWVFTGFPWLALGYSQAPGSPLAGFAPLLGVFGVSLASAAVSGALAVVFERAWSRRKLQAMQQLRSALADAAIWTPAVLIVLGLALAHYKWTTPYPEPTSIALIQGNIPQELKWRPEKARQTLDLYRELTLSSPAQLILLPETALPMFNVDLPHGYLERLAVHARANGGDLLTGIPEYAGPDRYYNSVISAGTAPTQIYRKVHLVPFGDYFPLQWLFGWAMRLLDIPMSDFSRGATDQKPIHAGGQKVAVNICYEDVFGEEIIRQLPEASLLANFTNDAWWGRSLGSRQHLQISQMRALETGRFMVRATNTGVTAIIDERGQVIRSAPEFEVAIVTGQVRGHSGSTPFIWWGNKAAVVLACTMIAVAVLLQLRRRMNRATALTGIETR